MSAFLRDTGWRPSLTETVAGATVDTTYNPVMRWMMRRISAQGGGPTDTSRDHEFTDCEQIDCLAKTIANLVAAPRAVRLPATV